jgi:hypothetical protein
LIWISAAYFAPASAIENMIVNDDDDDDDGNDGSDYHDGDSSDDHYDYYLLEAVDLSTKLPS